MSPSPAKPLPGPGISMVGYKFDVTSSNGTKANDVTSNIIVRYVADRRGNTISSANDDAIGVLGSTSDQNHNTHDVIHGSRHRIMGDG